MKRRYVTEEPINPDTLLEKLFKSMVTKIGLSSIEDFRGEVSKETERLQDEQDLVEQESRGNRVDPDEDSKSTLLGIMVFTLIAIGFIWFIFQFIVPVMPK